MQIVFPLKRLIPSSVQVDFSRTSRSAVLFIKDRLFIYFHKNQKTMSMLKLMRSARCFNSIRNINTTKAGNANARLKELQRQFQVDDGVPVHLKKGASDKIIFSLAAFAVAISVLDGLKFCYDVIYPPRNS